jgi:hypothetical protein
LTDSGVPFAGYGLEGVFRQRFLAQLLGLVRFAWVDASGEQLARFLTLPARSG